MSNKEFFFINTSDSIQKAIQFIDKGAIQAVFILDEQKRLCGVVTDGDIRRAILNNVALTQSVSEIMNKNPKFTKKGQLSRNAIFQRMLKDSIRQMPIVDQDGRVLEVVLMDEFIQSEVKQNRAVILAGGLGSRLKPLTDHTPKPLLKIGDRSILDIMIENFVNQGFQDLVVSVNYKSDMIKDHLGDGQNYGCSINYLEEPSPLGTAGPLALMDKAQNEEPILLINGDILTRINFSSLLQFHKTHNADLTVCLKEYEIQVPYGVVRVDEGNFKVDGIDEKPVQKFFVNAGIYAINPKVLEQIPKNDRFDMPDLMRVLREKGFNVVGYPVQEYWLDIGKMEDYKRAQFEYGALF